MICHAIIVQLMYKENPLHNGEGILFVYGLRAKLPYALGGLGPSKFF